MLLFCLIYNVHVYLTYALRQPDRMLCFFFSKPQFSIILQHIYTLRFVLHMNDEVDHFMLSNLQHPLYKKKELMVERFAPEFVHVYLVLNLFLLSYTEGRNHIDV